MEAEHENTLHVDAAILRIRYISAIFTIHLFIPKAGVVDGTSGNQKAKYISSTRTSKESTTHLLPEGPTRILYNDSPNKDGVVFYTIIIGAASISVAASALLLVGAVRCYFRKLKTQGSYGHHKAESKVHKSPSYDGHDGSSGSAVSSEREEN